MSDRYSKEDYGTFYVKRVNWKKGKYRIQKYKSRGPMYKRNYSDFFKLARTLDESDFSNEEWQSLQENVLNSFCDERDLYTYKVSYDTLYPDTTLIFDDITEGICQKNADWIFIDPYYEQQADKYLSNLNIPFEDIMEQAESLMIGRGEGFLHEQIAAYHLKILIDLLKSIAFYNPNVRLGEYLGKLHRKISSGFYQSHPEYIKILLEWLS